MSKFIFAFLALTLVTATQAIAADGVNSQFNGEYRARYMNHNNAGFQETGSKSSSFWDQRAKASGTFSHGKIIGHLGLVHASNWGQGDAMNGAAGEKVEHQSQIWVNQAWAAYMHGDSFTYKVGRIGLDIADGSVIALDDYQQLAYSFDGAVINYKTNFADFTVGGVKSHDTTTNYSKDLSEANFYGLLVEMKNLPDFLNMATLHYLVVHEINSQFGSEANNAKDRKDTARYGVTVAGAKAGFDYKATYNAVTGKNLFDSAAGTANTLGGSNANSGDEIKIDASMMDFAVGYTFADLHNLRIGAVYHSDTGDKSDDGDTADNEKNETYDSFYYNSHSYGGAMDVVMWGNLTYMGFGVSADITDDLALSVNQFTFERTQKEDGIMLDTTNFARNGGDDDSKKIGSEIDVAITGNCNEDKNFTWGLHYGQFDPGTYLSEKGGTYSRWYAETKFTF